eukprot:1608925-Prymnesium_polylepis.2
MRGGRRCSVHNFPVNCDFTVQSGTTETFFREPESAGPKMTPEKGWHHPTVSRLSKPVYGRRGSEVGLVEAQ